MGRRIKVKGIKKSEIDTEQLALVFWLQAKRVLADRRKQEQKAKDKQQLRERQQ